MKNALLLVILLIGLQGNANAQIDSLFTRKQQDSTKTKVNQDAVYNRPFINLGKSSTAVGGYLEGNTNYFVTDGVSEGFSMELRRFNIFLYSTISKRVKFLSELEFEHGTKEISLETAQLDFEINPALNLRAGILVAPIGAFNQKHDSPLWEFIERPLVATQLIPSTLSEVGFGVYGKIYKPNKVFTYDLYLVNGLRDEIIFNEEGRTFLPAGKSPEMFEEDNNGRPMFTGKLGFKQRKIGEIGLSYYGGVYNTFKLDGVKVAKTRNLSIYAFDFNTRIQKAVINGEIALVTVEVPGVSKPFFGTRQQGGYVEVVYPILKRSILDFESATLNLNLRAERIDYNVSTFDETGQSIGDEITAIVPGISFRPSTNTVFRANYRYHWIQDLMNNPTTRSAGFQFGFASYF